MAQSRLEKIGTIFSRVSNLIRTGAMNMNDRPLWYDVYKAFPPAVPPKFDRPVPNIPIKTIFYKEDIIRAKFQKQIGRSLPAINLKDTQFQTLTQKMIDLCGKIQKEKSLDFDTAYQEAFETIKNEELSRKDSQSERHASNISSTFKAALDSQKHENEPPVKLDVKNIFHEK